LFERREDASEPKQSWRPGWYFDIAFAQRTPTAIRWTAEKVTPDWHLAMARRPTLGNIVGI
jgi:hypothetical protein